MIDPKTGEPVADGEKGELVFTSLTKEAFPIIRYRTRDLTRLLPGTAVPAMRRMEKVTGRTDDMMIIRGVNVFPTQIEEFVLADSRLAPYFQCVLRQPGRMVELTVIPRVAAVVPGGEQVGADDDEEREGPHGSPPVCRLWGLAGPGAPGSATRTSLQHPSPSGREHAHSAPACQAGRSPSRAAVKGVA